MRLLHASCAPQAALDDSLVCTNDLGLLIDYSLSYGHHGLTPCSTHPGEGTVSLV